MVIYGPISVSLFSVLSFTTLISLLISSVRSTRMDGQPFPIEEATITDINQAFTENKLTSRQLVDFYLTRISELNPVLRSVVEVNPDARDLADEADREREGNRGRRSLGGLHGIPVLLKDSISTKDKLNTTAGSHALVGSTVARDAGVVERLRKAGAVVLGKASMSEWYRIRSLDGLPNGWCARAGQGVVSSLYLSLSLSTNSTVKAGVTYNGPIRVDNGLET